VGRTAVAAGIKQLYHYERFNPEYLADVLVKKRVHGSDPTNLNDPWDCRPWFDDKALDNAEAVEELINWFFSFTSTSPVSAAQARATQNEIRANSEYRRQILERFSQDFLKMIPGRWRIYCLTPVPDSTLMWSHYAANHKGICLEFATETAVFGSAQEVGYLSTYPNWAPHSLMTAEDPHILLTKSDDWQYEREFRVIGLTQGVDRPFGAHPLELDGPFLKIPDGALKAVIAGCEADYDSVRKVAKEAASNIKVKRAVRAPSRYRLEIVE
jgi:hypothetical protein